MESLLGKYAGSQLGFPSCFCQVLQTGRDSILSKHERGAVQELYNSHRLRYQTELEREREVIHITPVMHA